MHFCTGHFRQTVFDPYFSTINTLFQIIMTLIGTLQATNTDQLLKAVNSQKSYLFFDISVFNIGACIRIKCTDTYKEINRNTWNGYDFIIENDYTTEEYILNVLKDRLKDPDANLKATEILRIKKILKN